MTGSGTRGAGQAAQRTGPRLGLAGLGLAELGLTGLRRGVWQLWLWLVRGVGASPASSGWRRHKRRQLVLCTSREGTSDGEGNGLDLI